MTATLSTELTPRTVPPREFQPDSRIARRLRAVVRQPSFIIAAAALTMVLAWAIVPELFTGSDPLSGNTADRLQAPSPRHFFGTDHLGRDIYTRVVFGAGESVLATVLAVGIGLVGGSLLGLLAGFLGGRLDAVIMRAVDVLAAIPDLLLSLVIVTALGFGAAKVAIAVGVSAIAGFARVMRSSVIQVRSQAYVETATCLGLRPWTVIRRHVLPNALGPVVALAAISFGTTVLAIAALSFLGYGSPPPAPEWGAMVADGRNYLTVAWWLTTLPGLVIVMVVLSTNRLSRGLEAPGGRPGRRRR